MQKYINLQKFLFENSVNRIDLINYKTLSDKKYKIFVYRNHSFELIQNVSNAYLDYADINAEFIYSDYDDTLSFINLDLTSDMLIIWLDLTRYNIKNIDELINERLNYLTKKFFKPIILAPFGKNIKINNDKIIVYNFEKIIDELKDEFTDERLESFSGTKLSTKALTKCAMDLSLNYIPSLIKTNLKAIITDLDNTLYKGILGEDLISGIELTDGHRKLQETLKQKAKEGYFLCISSKNNKDDVIKLFMQRKDFPLKLEDFTFISASWDTKSKGINDILKFLNISSDDALFIDDNLGELAQVTSIYPEIKIIFANNDADITNNILKNFPGLSKFSIKHEDAIRSRDTKANEERKQIMNNCNFDEYLKSLNVKILYEINNTENIARISELSKKTNQFIFNYKRYSEAELTDLMKNTKCAVVNTKLEDKLSDSGIICVCTGRKNDEGVLLEECFVSCRALGRGLDEVIVLGSIQFLLDYLNSNKLKIQFIKGEKNIPAEKFVLKYLNEHLNDYSNFKYHNDNKNIIQLYKEKIK